MTGKANLHRQAFLIVMILPSPHAHDCLPGSVEKYDQSNVIAMLQTDTRLVLSQTAADLKRRIAEVGAVFEPEQADFLHALDSHGVGLSVFTGDWFASECPAAYEAHDFAAYAMKMAARRALMPDGTYPQHGFGHGQFHTAPGTWAQGARLCYDAGFLDLPKEALWNFTQMEELSERECHTLRQNVSSLESHSASIQMSLTDPDANLRYVSHKCDLGNFFLGCAVANCMYSYCFLSDGRVGQGKQCSRNWMNASLVSPHIEAAFGFSP